MDPWLNSNAYICISILVHIPNFHINSWALIGLTGLHTAQYLFRFQAL